MEKAYHRESILSATPSPCLDCPQRHRCGVKKIACYDYARFAHCLPNGMRAPKNRREANELYYTWVFGGAN